MSEPSAQGNPDVVSIDAVISAFYEIISGARGEPRDWKRDIDLFVPGAIHVAMSVREGKPFALPMDHAAHVARAEAIFREVGFYEREIHRVERRFGNIVQIFSAYESRHAPDGPVFARGVNFITLFFDGARWWIASAVWDGERPDNPIPPEWLPPEEQGKS
jgi:hypothetical protein